jgi:hypothetical protein
MRIDADLKTMTAGQLRQHIMKIRTRLRSHAKATNNERCWLNDRRLYELLPEHPTPQPITLQECAFLANCKRYYRRQK